MNTIIKKMVIEDINFNHNGKVSYRKAKEIIKTVKNVWRRANAKV